jgi:hypothetical protein
MYYSIAKRIFNEYAIDDKRNGSDPPHIDPTKHWVFNHVKLYNL